MQNELEQILDKAQSLQAGLGEVVLRNERALNGSAVIYAPGRAPRRSNARRGDFENAAQFEAELSALRQVKINSFFLMLKKY